MSVEGSGEWFNEWPGTDGIYRLIGASRNRGESPSRLRAIVALGESGDPRAVRPLVECCEDDRPEVRRLAVEGLVRLESVRSVRALIERLKDQTEGRKTRTRAADGLGIIRSYSAIDGLIERLLDPGEDDAIRIHVAEVLGRTGSRKACESLERCEREGDPGLRRAVDTALHSLRGRGLSPSHQAANHPLTPREGEMAIHGELLKGH